MARPLRIEFEGALYHVTARGDRLEPIYEDDEDRVRFLRVLGEVVGEGSMPPWLAVDDLLSRSANVAPRRAGVISASLPKVLAREVYG